MSSLDESGKENPSSSSTWLNENRKWVITTLLSAIPIGGVLLALLNRYMERPMARDDAPQSHQAVDTGATLATGLQRCLQQHHLSRAHERQGESSSLTFASCEWPAPSYADADGFSEIRITYGEGPGESESSDSNVLDRISSNCARLELAYSFGYQGDSRREEPFTANRGDVLSAFTGRRWDGNTPYPYPRRDEIVVVRNSHIDLDEARCVM